MRCTHGKTTRLRRTASLTLGLLLVAPCSGALAQLADPDVSGDSTSVEVQPRVERKIQEDGRAPVFIVLREDTLAMDERKVTVANALGGDFELWHRYQNIPVIAGQLSRAGLESLRRNPAVSAIQLDGTGSGGLAEAVPAVGVDKVHSVRGLTGKGVTVAVLDSGTTTRHPALQGAVVAQHCFTRFGCPPSGANEGDSGEDDHNHGSNVSGIVASRGGGGVSKGFAPGANLVAVKVLNSQNAGQVSDWVAGFDWVLSNREKLDITVINASLVSDQEYADAASCDQGEVAMAMIVKKLFDAGVTITASSGNTGHTMTMTSPACNTGVIAVGATYDKDLGKQPEGGSTYRALGGGRWPACSDDPTNAKTIACFTSTAGKRLDLLAPGSQISSTGRGTGTSMFRGTSQAAPAVAGLSALLLECNPSLTPTQILSILKMTGESVTDPRSMLSYPLIRGVEAADMACGMGVGGLPAGAAGASGAALPSAGAQAPGAAGSGAGMGMGMGTGVAGGAGTAAPGFAGAGAANTASGATGITGPAMVGRPSLAGAGASSSGRPGTPGVGAGAAGQGGVATGQIIGAQTAAPAAEPSSGCACSAPGVSRGTTRQPSSVTLVALAAFLGVLFAPRLARRRKAGRV